MRLIDQYRQFLHPESETKKKKKEKYSVDTAAYYFMLSFTIAYQMDNNPRNFNFNYYLHPVYDAEHIAVLTDMLNEHLKSATLTFFNGQQHSENESSFINDDIYSLLEKKEDQVELYRLIRQSNDPAWKMELKKLKMRTETTPHWMLEQAADTVKKIYQLDNDAFNSVIELFYVIYGDFERVSPFLLESTYHFADQFARRLNRIKAEAKANKRDLKLNLEEIGRLFFTIMIVSVKLVEDQAVYVIDYTGKNSAKTAKSWIVKRMQQGHVTLNDLLLDEEKHLHAIGYNTFLKPERVREIFQSLHSDGQRNFMELLIDSENRFTDELIAALPVEQSSYWIVNALLQKIQELYPIPLQEDCSQLNEVQKQIKIQQELRQVKKHLEAIIENLTTVIEQLDEEHQVKRAADKPLISPHITHHLMHQLFERLTNPIYNRDEIITLFYVGLIANVNKNISQYQIKIADLVSLLNSKHLYDHLEKALTEQMSLYNPSSNLPIAEVCAIYRTLDEPNRKRFYNSVEDQGDEADVELMCQLLSINSQIDLAKAAAEKAAAAAAAATTPASAVGASKATTTRERSTSAYKANSKPAVTLFQGVPIVPRDPNALPKEPNVISSVQAASSSPFFSRPNAATSDSPNETTKTASQAHKKKKNDDDDNDDIFKFSPPTK